MWNYTEKVMDHFLHPRNVGEIENPDAVGEVGNIVCGDALKIFLRLDAARERVEDVRFQTFGCASAIASASALTELVKGRPLTEVARITNQDIAAYLGELPEEKMHCSVMGMEALQSALAGLQGRSADSQAVSPDHDQGYDPKGLDRTVCYCFSVTERRIREIAKANDLHQVDAVTHYCKAGGGCGGCRPEIEKILRDLWGTEPAPVETRTEDRPKPLTSFQKMRLVQQAIDDDIRPALRDDGGDLELLDIEGDKVTVKLKGSCAACPSAHVTLKCWVEARLRERVAATICVAEA